MVSEKKVHSRPAGFYVTALAALVCIVAALYYSTNFRGKVYTHGPLFNEYAFYGLIIAAVVAFLMLFMKLEGFAPVVLCIASGISFLVFIYHMVWPIADVFTGIDTVVFLPQMITTGALLLGAFILSEIALYMKKRWVTA